MMRSVLEKLQPLGRALMLPIAVLPIASLLLRLGQPDLFDIAFMSAAGEAIFSHLGLLFAVGVATGFARDGNGAASLAGVVCFLVAQNGAQVLVHVPAEALIGVDASAAKSAISAYQSQAIAKLEVPMGIISGLVGGHFYNRFSTIKLPEYLAFFGGRRFVPIVSGVAGLAMAGLVGFCFEAVNSAIDSISLGVVSAGGVGLFFFGLLNRLLLVTGLHHIINNVAWFVVGDYHGTSGDLRRFFAGDPGAGAFMSGFFPIMMFGLPAACLAMYHAAPRDRRKAVGGMLLSLALTSFLTGVTEPIEFSFMFLAPVLYGIHAVMTGISMALMDALGVHMGFGFSAGLLDYILNFSRATRPLLLLPVGAAYFLIYYCLFRTVIVRFNLMTPGREPMTDEGQKPAATTSQGGRGAAFAAALGGRANLVSVDACTTRLRLIVNDQSRIDEPVIKSLGARGLIKPSDKAVQIVLGPIADAVAVEIREALDQWPSPSTARADLFPASSPLPDRETVADLPPEVLRALGGPDNVRAVTAMHSRIAVQLADGTAIDAVALKASGMRGMAEISKSRFHLLFAPNIIESSQVKH
jgi:PTS system N-acetylglucosamine-specific IIC component